MYENLMDFLLLLHGLEDRKYTCPIKISTFPRGALSRATHFFTKDSREYLFYFFSHPVAIQSSCVAAILDLFSVLPSFSNAN